MLGQRERVNPEELGRQRQTIKDASGINREWCEEHSMVRLKAQNLYHALSRDPSSEGRKTQAPVPISSV